MKRRSRFYHGWKLELHGRHVETQRKRSAGVKKGKASYTGGGLDDRRILCLPLRMASAALMYLPRRIRASRPRRLMQDSSCTVVRREGVAIGALSSRKRDMRSVVNTDLELAKSAVCADARFLSLGAWLGVKPALILWHSGVIDSADIPISLRKHPKAFPQTPPLETESYSNFHARKATAEAITGYNFRDDEYLKAALRPGNAPLHGEPIYRCQSQLAIIGDSLLRLAYFTHNFPDTTEGKAAGNYHAHAWIGSLNGPFDSISSNSALAFTAWNNGLAKAMDTTIPQAGRAKYGEPNIKASKIAVATMLITDLSSFQAVFGAVFLDSDQDLGVTKQRTGVRRPDGNRSGLLILTIDWSRAKFLTAPRLQSEQLMEGQP
ncbi:uncharacterized protein MYCFIDRAFT_177076 [Pseudocercospora fijiensis CIRAD86]|uniref:RNase III domain-containing protein n=1 Tax=Pseudocercospora fijiensis (strain CIRAD86) TaxID=383855 RepID=M3ARN3_PSEFD|nr:uncharacterized protein MYCFIDRAFT_177076 [Pseudocercospora fijiensis CIRAD86]EME80097.1 hypothetical protein MYCFIDRAFT_177076 [Pseudocercospora fijiensis CIRAD86]